MNSFSSSFICNSEILTYTSLYLQYWFFNTSYPAPTISTRNMVDTLLLHHYQRLWKVEATPEIIQTRPRSSSKTRSIGRSPGLLRKHFSSASNLCQSPYLPINNSGLDYSTEVKMTLTSVKLSNVPTAMTRVSFGRN